MAHIYSNRNRDCFDNLDSIRKFQLGQEMTDWFENNGGFLKTHPSIGKDDGNVITLDPADSSCRATKIQIPQSTIKDLEYLKNTIILQSKKSLCLKILLLSEL